MLKEFSYYLKMTSRRLQKLQIFAARPKSWGVPPKILRLSWASRLSRDIAPMKSTPRCRHSPTTVISKDTWCSSPAGPGLIFRRSEEHTSELQSRFDLVCRLLLEKKNL